MRGKLKKSGRKIYRFFFAKGDVAAYKRNN